MITTTREKVFISYSHKDRKWLNELKLHLSPYDRAGLLEIWDDTHIKPGERWRHEIEQALKNAKVAVLLVSPHFLDSEFIAQHELPPLLVAANSEGLTILWVAVSSSSFQKTDLAIYQAGNDPEDPLDAMSKSRRNTAWVDICKKIEAAINP